VPLPSIGSGGEPVPVIKSANRQKVMFAREQRREPSKAEKMLWQELRNAKLGAKFRRQHPFGRFVLDFYCDEARLVVEVDGPLHDAQADYDDWRDRQLLAQGLWVLRFQTEAVEANVVLVTDEIRKVLGDMLGEGRFAEGERH
jgi:very-short-patch-repair endonuclease